MSINSQLDLTFLVLVLIGLLLAMMLSHQLVKCLIDLATL